MSAVLRSGRVALVTGDPGHKSDGINSAARLLRVGGRCHAEPPMARSGENALLGVAEFASVVRQRVIRVSRRYRAARSRRTSSTRAAKVVPSRGETALQGFWVQVQLLGDQVKRHRAARQQLADQCARRGHGSRVG